MVCEVKRSQEQDKAYSSELLVLFFTADGSAFALTWGRGKPRLCLASSRSINNTAVSTGLSETPHIFLGDSKAWGGI